MGRSWLFFVSSCAILWTHVCIFAWMERQLLAMAPEIAEQDRSSLPPSPRTPSWYKRFRMVKYQIHEVNLSYWRCEGILSDSCVVLPQVLCIVWVSRCWSLSSDLMVSSSDVASSIFRLLRFYSICSFAFIQHIAFWRRIVWNLNIDKLCFGAILRHVFHASVQNTCQIQIQIQIQIQTHACSCHNMVVRVFTYFGNPQLDIKILMFAT